MEKPLDLQIKQCIEYGLREGDRFILYPFGNVGMQVKEILTSLYNIEPEYIIDNKCFKHDPGIKPVSYLDSIDCSKFKVILSSTNREIYRELKRDLLKRFESSVILELECMKGITICGKHSFGPLCEHRYVESIGAFCSVAEGCDVVPNHPVDLISTHPMLYWGGSMGLCYEDYIGLPQYVEGVHPKGLRHKTAGNRERITIGNDVWLGKNVIITNGSNIGNGVIAGAGAIITKDVPDYAVVAGNPARIIRYRYGQEFIRMLNEIKWWEWPDELIAARQDDFYISVEDFCDKYY